MSRVAGVISTLTDELSGRVDSFEIFLSSRRGLGIEAKGGEVDALNLSRSSGVGIRVIKDRRLGFAFSSDLGEDSLKQMLEVAVDGSIEVSKDEFLSFPLEQEATPVSSLGLYDEEIDNITEDKKISMAMKLEEAALRYDTRVRRVRKASYKENKHNTRIINSNGLDKEYSSTRIFCSIMVVAERNGESQMGWDMDTSRYISDIDVERVGRHAARRAVDMLGARPIDTIRCNLLLENSVVCELMEVLASSFLLDNLKKGKSMLKGKIGNKIASSTVNIWDNGLLPKGWATAPFDAEGTPTQKTALVIDGVCQGYLSDTYWGRRTGAGSTGNAVRSAYKNLPTVGITNIYMEGKGPKLKDLISDMGKGLFITELLGVHTANPITGDFSLGAAGFWVEGGEVSYPVRGMAISGNLVELLLKIEKVGGDLRFFGSVGAPSIVLRDVEVSGSK
jgi:PmbA protein